MSIIITIFNTLFFGPIVNILVGMLRLLEFLHVPGSLGFSIILLTITIKLVLWPLTTTQIRSSKKMTDLKPHIDALKKKHGKDAQGFSKAQMALYKEHGINPAAGCLPALLQIPVFIALYQTISTFFVNTNGLSHINSLLYVPSWHLHALPSLNFLGVSLASKPADFLHAGYFLLLIPFITAALQMTQSLMMFPRPVKTYSSDSTKEKKEKETTEDAMQQAQSQMMYLMPLMVGFFAFQFPVGLSLYWNSFSIFGIIQQYKVAGLGGLGEIIQKLTIKKY